MASPYSPILHLADRMDRTANNGGRGRDTPARYRDDRRSRSPYRARLHSRSRSPPPFRGNLSERIGRTAPWEARRLEREGMFAGIKYHFFSTNAAESKAAKRISTILNREGAKGCRNIIEADVILVHAPDWGLDKLVQPEPINRSLKECYQDGFAQNEIFQYLASRLHRELDHLRYDRKSVVQSGWVEACIQHRARLESGNMGGYEIRVNNTPAPFLSVRRPISTSVQAAPLPPRPEPRAEVIPTSVDPRRRDPLSLHTLSVPPILVPSPQITEHAASLPPRPVAVLESEGQGHFTSEPMDIEPVEGPAPCSGDDSPTTPFETPPNPGMLNRSDPVQVKEEIVEIEDRKPDISSWSSIKSDRWKPPSGPSDNRQIATCVPAPPQPSVTQKRVANQPVMSPVMQAPNTLPQPVSQLNRQPSSQDAIPMRSTVTAPRTSQSLPASTHIPRASSVRSAPLYAAPIQSTPATQSASPSPAIKPTHRGVFNPIGVPMAMHVFDSASDKMATVMITRVGGGLIVPLEQASFIIIPEADLRVARTGEQVELIKNVTASDRPCAVLSKDWVTECINQNDLLDTDPYRVALPSDEGNDQYGMAIEEDMPAPEIIEIEQESILVHKQRATPPEQTSRPSSLRPSLPLDASFSAQTMADDDDDDGIVFVSMHPQKTGGDDSLEGLARTGMPTPPLTPAVRGNQLTLETNEWTRWTSTPSTLSPRANSGGLDAGPSSAINRLRLSNAGTKVQAEGKWGISKAANAVATPEDRESAKKTMTMYLSNGLRAPMRSPSNTSRTRDSEQRSSPATSGTTPFRNFASKRH